jgi:hypothetical protein
MSILDDLKELQQTAAIGRGKHLPAGDSYISDGVVFSTLYRLEVDEQVIKDVLLEPVESRENWINYFETVGRKK